MIRATSASPSQEGSWSWTRWARQSHRWLSIAFTVAVVVNVVVNALGWKGPAVAVGSLTLLPLALLLFTGLTLFALPYVSKRRRARSSSATT
jgi:hypothetical protein